MPAAAILRCLTAAPPEGWRVLHAGERLEARWAGEHGTWAAFTAGTGARPVRAAVVVERVIGGTPLVLALDGTARDPGTRVAVQALVAALDRAIVAAWS